MTTLVPLHRELSQRCSKNRTTGRPCDPAVRELHWLPVTARIKYKLYWFRSNGWSRAEVHHGPADTGRWNFRLVCCASTHGDSAVQGARLGSRRTCVFCCRPIQLKLWKSTTLLRRKLKTFLFTPTYENNNIWTLWCALGQTIVGAIQRTVILWNLL